MTEKSSCPVLRGRDDGNILLLDGKTQTAVEYAHRYREEYQYILWVQANTSETLLANFVALARLLSLPEQMPGSSRLSSRRSNSGWRRTATGCSSSTMPTTWP